MARFYQPPDPDRGTMGSIVVGLVLTGFVFVILPFTQVASQARRQLELRRVEVAAPPPPLAEEPPPPPPPPEREPPPPPPNLDSPMSPPLVADLDMALGVGGAMAGLVDLRAMTQGAGASDLFDVTDLERRPEVVSQVPPAYPAELRKARVEGSVLLVFVVAEDGSVVDPRVESASRPEFEKPALDALKRWRFRPGTKDGEPVRTYMRLPMRFRVGG